MAINKADGDNVVRAERARAEYASALHLFPASGDGWTPRVLSCSALNNAGIAEIWEMVLEHEALLQASGRIAERRTRGALQWMDDLISVGLADLFYAQPAIAERLPTLRREVLDGLVTPLAASRELLGLFDSAARTPPKEE
jgi:LAO/AO transport system kinase